MQWGVRDYSKIAATPDEPIDTITDGQDRKSCPSNRSSTHVRHHCANWWRGLPHTPNCPAHNHQPSYLPQQPRQLGDVGGDPPGLITCKQVFFQDGAASWIYMMDLMMTYRAGHRLIDVAVLGGVFAAKP